MGEIGWWKSCLRKSKMSVRFFGCDFHHPISPIAVAGLSDSWSCVFVQHFWEFVFNFFGCDFCHPISTHRNRKALEFVILCLPPTFLRIYNFQKYLTKTQYCEFEAPAIVIGGGGLDDKNCCHKNKDYEVGRLFFDIYRHWVEPDDEADRPHSTR